jgi:hypothetical protein
MTRTRKPARPGAHGGHPVACSRRIDRPSLDAWTWGSCPRSRSRRGSAASMRTSPGHLFLSALDHRRRHRAGAISACFRCAPAARSGCSGRGAPKERNSSSSPRTRPVSRAFFGSEPDRHAEARPGAGRDRHQAEPFRQGAWRGLAVQLARADGSRAAYGAPSPAGRTRGRVTVIIVIAVKTMRHGASPVRLPRRHRLSKASHVRAERRGQSAPIASSAPVDGLALGRRVPRCCAGTFGGPAVVVVDVLLDIEPFAVPPNVLSLSILSTTPRSCRSFWSGSVSGMRSSSSALTAHLAQTAANGPWPAACPFSMGEA